MYKIEGEDLYLIGTVRALHDRQVHRHHSTTRSQLPQTLTSYSPCFRKEVGAHGIEERGVYRIHQFEKQEMIVVCKPEESKMWYRQTVAEHRRFLPLDGHSGSHAGVLLRRPG